MANVAKTQRCNCSDPNCPRIICTVCGNDASGAEGCKWPGECRGKCKECGQEARPSGLPDVAAFDPPLYDCYCSEKCEKTAWDRGIALGTVVMTSDLTPEQLNEAFNNSGLGLVGVGKRNPS